MIAAPIPSATPETPRRQPRVRLPTAPGFCRRAMLAHTHADSENGNASKAPSPSVMTSKPNPIEPSTVAAVSSGDFGPWFRSGCTNTGFASSGRAGTGFASLGLAESGFEPPTLAGEPGS